MIQIHSYGTQDYSLNGKEKEQSIHNNCLTHKEATIIEKHYNATVLAEENTENTVFQNAVLFQALCSPFQEWK